MMKNTTITFIESRHAVRDPEHGDACFVRNWNKFSHHAIHSPSTRLFLEPLIRLNRASYGSVLPWLAESWTWDSSGSILYLTLRDDVRWSDGKPLDSLDVKFTLDMPLKQPTLRNLWPVRYERCEVMSKTTLRLDFGRYARHLFAAFAEIDIVPRHQWEGKELTTWENTDPIGTGPMELVEFSPDCITLQLKSNWWGGSFAHVRTAKVFPGVDSEQALQSVRRGEVDWAQLGYWAKMGFRKQGRLTDTAQIHNFPWGGADCLIFNTAKPPLESRHVRRALCNTLDRSQLARHSHTEHRLASVAILDDQLYGDWIADGLRPPTGDVSNVLEAQSEIANANYWIEDGWLRTDDDSYKPSLLVTAERQDLVAHARLVQRQWQKNLNLDVEVNALPRHQVQAERANGNFDILYDSVSANQGALATYDSLFGTHWLRPIGEAVSGNFGRWHNDHFESLLKLALEKDEQANSYDLCHQMQGVIAHELPVYAIHLSDLSFVISHRWAGWPEPMAATYIPSLILGPDAALTMKNLRPN